MVEREPGTQTRDEMKAEVALEIVDAAVWYVAARDAVEAADGKSLMDAVWRQDEAWHALRIAVGAPCESEDCGCERPVEVLAVETPKCEGASK